MRMLVDQRLVPMHMHVRLLAVPWKIMFVVMVFIVSMHVRMLHRLVHVLMFVPFTQMQPDAERHQGCGHPEQHPRDFRPDQEGDHDTK